MSEFWWFVLKLTIFVAGIQLAIHGAIEECRTAETVGAILLGCYVALADRG